MPLVSFEDVSLQLGDQRLLAHADLAIEPGERVCLIGRNGAGKTSLLRLITGRLEPDDGEIHTQSRIRVSELEQALPEELRQTVREYVTTGLADLQDLIDLYQQRSQETLDRKGLMELEALHREIDAHGGWHLDQRVDTVLSELALPAGPAAGGAVRRLAAPGWAGPGHRRQRRAAAARRAHQPSRPEHDPVARGPGLQLRGQRPVHHPRPRLPAAARHPHRGAGPHPAHELARHL